MESKRERDRQTDRQRGRETEREREKRTIPMKGFKLEGRDKKL